MSSKPTISIIIPVYNVESWLERAVTSLLQQSFEDFELWLVNDGSTDNSGEMCDRLAESDDRIKVIHRKNGGAASARNAAIPKAQGKYVYFMDGDDWCEPNMLEDMHRLASQHEADLVVTGFYIDTYYTEEKYYREMRNAPNKVFSSQKEFREYSYRLFDAQLLYAPWNKLYRREYLQSKGILFPQTFWDDLPFNLAVIRDVERVACLDGHYYHFLRARAESENTKYRSDMYEKREEEHVWLQELYAYWQVDSSEVQEFLARRYSERLVGCIENLTNKNCDLSKKDKRKEVESMLAKPQAKEALERTRPKSFMMKIILWPLKHQKIGLALLMSSFISLVKQNSTNLFARLKANR